MSIRIIDRNDHKSVKLLTEKAFLGTEFGYQGEAELIESIRNDATYQSSLELVYEKQGNIIGHCLLSECTVKNETGIFIGLALAPLSVMPEHQKTGIGSQLMVSLEKKSILANYPFIIILGDPNFYTKFGYLPANQWNIYPPFDVPSEFFLVKELKKNYLNDVTGTVQYLTAFE